MRNGCLAKLRSKYLGKRCNKGEITTEKTKEAWKPKVEECWKREGMEEKTHVHDPSTANKNISLRVIKEMANEKFDDTPALDKSMDTEKDEKSNEKQKVEQGSGKVDVNRTKAGQDSTHDQAIPLYQAEFCEWDVCDPATATADSFRVMFNKPKDERRRRGALNDEFYKVKTFDLRGIKSGGRK